MAPIKGIHTYTDADRERFARYALEDDSPETGAPPQEEPW